MKVSAALRVAAASLLVATPSGAQQLATGDSVSFIRVNQIGYLPESSKVGVVCSLEPRVIETFSVSDSNGRQVLPATPAVEAGAFGPCATTHRLDFSSLEAPGDYRIAAGGAVSPVIRIAADVYDGTADVLLEYMRQQRSGYNPIFRDSVHESTDGILVDHERAGELIEVTGGWADAADYLQYVTTSANATFQLLLAYRDNPTAFGDLHDADGLPGSNGVPDVLDEARHGLEWLVKMYPEDDLMLNQLGDDRDHAFLDLPATDSSDYGWGKGGYRPVYPCTGEPQGLLGNKNRSEGYASTAGKFASAMALGSAILDERDPDFARVLRAKSLAAYELGRKYPGVCQTAPAGAPYFYEEDNWVDDMELAAA